MNSLKEILENTWKLSRYNLRIIFGGKFGYFILAALLFFLTIGTIMAFDGSRLDAADAYGLIIFPGILLVFYPSAFGIQNDVDQRTIEIIFGVPDYRYKVWLVRFILIILIVFVLLIPFALITHVLLVSIPIMKVVLQLMVIVLFTSTLGFGLSTLVKNGNGTAVIMVIIGVAFLILSDPLYTSKWNIFLNPFMDPSWVNDFLWEKTVRQNRMILMISSAVFLLIGLLNLQKREKFLKA